jgi:peptidoglycan hydrolase-like protein with peptidoglycan-binding domain
MATGFLKVEVASPANDLPITNATVTIYDKSPQRTITQGQTDENGQTAYYPLSAPEVANTLNRAQTAPAYSLYDVEVSADGFNTSYIHDVEILADTNSTLPVKLIPLLPEDQANNISRVFHTHLQRYDGEEEDTVYTDQPESDIEITEHALRFEGQTPQAETTQTPQAPETYGVHDVYIPTNITVHLGTPNNSSARNVTVPFADYIANVASSEIYATWPTQSLYANMFAITTFAINRIYTEWYRGRGYNFDITNNTAYDQYFVYGRNIYDNLRQIANEIFDMYVRRIGYKNPLFTQYCSGTTVTCPGLSQWGTVDLANRGYTALQILKYYYGNDVEVVESSNVRAIQETYPGSTMREGMSSEYIKLMQTYLNRIRLNYPAINNIANPNGYFGADTTSAVKAFQKAFGLTQDGVIGRATWNKISQIYVGIVKLAELKSEGERAGIGTVPPTTTLRQGSTGNLVSELQYMINYISEYYDYVPDVTQDGKFGAGTANAVKEFQRNFNLTADGIVGSSTWNKLYEVYNNINKNSDVPLPDVNQILPEYPGTVLTVGSRGVQVGYVQKSLTNLNAQYPKIPAVANDNVYGNATATAVRAFQEQFGLTPDGVVGQATWNKINAVLLATGDANQNTRPVYPNEVSKLGSRGTNVIYIQKSLQTISQYWTGIPNPGTADGVFGAKTDASVKAFQREFGLTPDGIVGQVTWNKINDTLNSIVV